MSQQDNLERLGRYEIVRELGRGAMGVVYEGRDPNIGRRVAIKTARRDVMESSTRADELMARFLREARAAGSLSHPNIVTIYDADEENGVAYIAMEFLDGTDLHKLIEQKRRFTTEQVLGITSTVCRALAHAHAHGVVHRDIKPSNIVMLENATIKVADFGIAHVSDSQLTQEGSMIGTPHYMSPEQFMGHAVDGRSDLFSVGVIVYEMLTGERPFHGGSINAVMHNVLYTNPVPPHQLNFDVSECLSRVVLKALSKDPKKRYQTAEAMADALWECTKEHPDPRVTQITSVNPANLAATVMAEASGEATVAMQTSSAGVSGADEVGTLVRHTGEVTVVSTGIVDDLGTHPGGPEPGSGARRRKTRRAVIVGAVTLAVLALSGGLTAFLVNRGDNGAPNEAPVVSFLDATSPLPAHYAHRIQVEGSLLPEPVTEAGAPSDRTVTYKVSAKGSDDRPINAEGRIDGVGWIVFTVPVTGDVSVTGTRDGYLPSGPQYIDADKHVTGPYEFELVKNDTAGSE